jgi:hypothetical protein
MPAVSETASMYLTRILARGLIPADHVKAGAAFIQLHKRKDSD